MQKACYCYAVILGIYLLMSEIAPAVHDFLCCVWKYRYRVCKSRCRL